MYDSKSDFLFLAISLMVYSTSKADAAKDDTLARVKMILPSSPADGSRRNTAICRCELAIT